MKALGMIEVNGYLAAVEAADAALKAANVKLLALEKVKAGITNVQITGDVGAVKAAVDAAGAAADNLGRLRGIHVIPSPSEELSKILPKIKPVEPLELLEKTIEIINGDGLENIEEVKKEDSKENSKEISEKDKIETIDDFNIIVDSEEVEIENRDFESMKVEELRNLVKKLNLPNMSNKKIKLEKKDDLIKILKEHDGKGDK